MPLTTLARPRAHTADVPVKARDGLDGSFRQGYSTGHSSHENQAWILGGTKESRRKIVKTAPGSRQETASPEPFEEGTTVSHGSPLRHAAVNYPWDDQKNGTYTPTTERTDSSWADMLNANPPWLEDEEQSKDSETLSRKPSRWKKLGGLFKSKNNQPPPQLPFYEVRVNDRQVQSMNSTEYISDPHLFQRQPMIQDARLWPTRSQSLPRYGDSPDYDDDSRLHSAEPDLLDGASREQGCWEPWSEISPGPEPLSTEMSNAPHLNVHIPDFELERYSVMFGSLRHRRSKPTNHTYLSDKAGNLAPQPMLSKQYSVPRPRRATSPGPAKSPTFSLFPSNVTNNNKYLQNSDFQRYAPGSSTPLQRSYTMPPSPDTSYFKIDRTGHVQSPLEASVSSESHPESPTCLSISGSEFYDASSDDEEIETIKLSIRPPKQDEPVWEMITPGQKSLQSTRRKSKIAPIACNPASTKKGQLMESTSSSKTYKIPPIPLPFRNALHPVRVAAKSGASSSSSVARPGSKNGSHKSSPSIDSYNDEDFQTVEISIARSISVSKRKRILVPIKGKSKTTPRSNGRLVEKKVATPTSEAVHKGHRHEKSRVALFEDAGPSSTSA